MWDVIMQSDMVEGVDYEIISQEMWVFLSRYTINNINRRYKIQKAIIRDSVVENGIKTVNVNLFKIKMVAIFPSSIQKMKGNRTGSTLIKGDQYVSRTTKLKDFVELLQKTL